MGKRRGRGEGAIYQRADGLWCSSVDLGVIDGKRRRKVIYGRTRKEVVEQLKRLQRDQAMGVNLRPEKLTVAEFLAQWLEQIVKMRNRPSTYESYSDMVTRHIAPAIGALELSRLTAGQVQAMLNGLAASGLAPRTVQYIRNSVLSGALNVAVKWGYVARNVAALTDSPRVEQYQVKPLEQEQAQRLLDAVKGHRLEALYRVALSLGMRKGEILGLRWEDVDFTKRTIRVVGAIQEVEDKLVWTQPKTKAGVRTLFLPPVLLRALQSHRRLQEQERQVRADEWTEHGLVFPSELGTPMWPRNLVRHFKTVLHKAGLPKTIRFHDLRHSCATLLIAQGVHPRVVMEILGHSQISVTMNTYAHVLPDTQRDAQAKLDALFPDDASENAGTKLEDEANVEGDGDDVEGEDDEVEGDGDDEEEAGDEGEGGDDRTLRERRDAHYALSSESMSVW
jgi:integrase